VRVVGGQGRSNHRLKLVSRNRSVPRLPENVFLRPPPYFHARFRIVRISTSSSYVRPKMPREAEISVNEREFIQEALKEQIRLDGRAFDAFRSLELTFGDEYGVADVQLGKSRFAIPIMV
jgi:hypothetical protein